MNSDRIFFHAYNLLHTQIFLGFHSICSPKIILEFEDLDNSAHRTLNDLTGLKEVYLQQFHTFGSPHRINNKEDLTWIQNTYNVDVNRIISVGYYSLLNVNLIKKNIISSNANWYNISEIKELAMDHLDILKFGLTHLRKELKINPAIGYELLPPKFTLRQLQTVYEIILGAKLDNRNFRKKKLTAKYIVPLEEKEKGVAHKPAQLFTFDKETFHKSRKENYIFSL